MLIDPGTISNESFIKFGLTVSELDVQRPEPPLLQLIAQKLGISRKID